VFPVCFDQEYATLQIAIERPGARSLSSGHQSRDIPKWPSPLAITLAEKEDISTADLAQDAKDG